VTGERSDAGTTSAETLGLAGAKADTRRAAERAASRFYRDSFDVPARLRNEPRAEHRVRRRLGGPRRIAGLDLQLLPAGPARLAAPRRTGLRRPFSGRSLGADLHAERARPRHSWASPGEARKPRRSRGRAADRRRRPPTFAASNAYFQRARAASSRPFTPQRTSPRSGPLIGAVFGAGGGHEAQERRVPVRAATAARAGEGLRRMGATLREANRNPQTSRDSREKSFPYEDRATGYGVRQTCRSRPGSFTPFVAGGPGPLASTCRSRHRADVETRSCWGARPLDETATRIFRRGSAGWATTRPKILMEEDLHGGRPSTARGRRVSRSLGFLSRDRDAGPSITRGARRPRART